MNALARCIELAKKGHTTPNPRVGCVIVRNNNILAEGYHKKAGRDHAEIDALRKINFKAHGATMYVSLEPCCHHGRTPPCVGTIIESGIKKVIIGMKDPNPLVSGKGIKKLRKNNISVALSTMDKEMKKLNEFYVKYITKKMPFVAMKYAMTLDGKIATVHGDSKWITNKKSRKYTHELRDTYDAILVGITTVMNDNPRLTCRVKRGNDPLRIIVDSSLKIPLAANVLKDNNVLIAVTKNYNKSKKITLEKKGISVLVVNRGKKVSLKKLMKELAKRDITSVLIEGGSHILTSALKERIGDKLYCFISPKIIGAGIPPVHDLGLKKMKDALCLRERDVRQFGEDVMISGHV